MVASVLCVGLVCVDIVTVCEYYPEEDSDQRAKSLHWQRGGNAASTSIVLSNLGTKVEFFGSVPNIDAGGTSWGLNAARFALQDLKDHGVDTGNVNLMCGCDSFPTSSITVNSSNGSRTIIHHRGDLEELKSEDFLKLDIENYNWVHFEGRPNVKAIGQAANCITKVNKENPASKIKISIELEKPCAKDLMTVCTKADLIFVSKEFAMSLGYDSALEAVKGIKTKLKESAEIICTWGSVGSAYASNDGTNSATLLDAISPEKVVDTIGAGDAFIGGVIHSRSQGYSLNESVEFGCRVAERKISHFGFDHVTDMRISVDARPGDVRNGTAQSTK